MEQNLATPQSMRALAATIPQHSPASMKSFPRTSFPAFSMLRIRFRSIGPADPRATTIASQPVPLLHAIASSLQNNHQDSWLTEFLPSPSVFQLRHLCPSRPRIWDSRSMPICAETIQLRTQMVRTRICALSATEKHSWPRSHPGRTNVRALQRSYSFTACRQVRASLIGDIARFRWIDAQSATLDVTCNEDSGSATANNPSSNHAAELAQSSHYVLLQFRARNLLVAFAVESGDTETAWRMSMATIREFYAGDYPAFRAGTSISGLAAVEDSTPRTHLHLLLCREVFGIFSLSPNKSILAETRADWIRAAIRAGSLQEAREQLAFAPKGKLAPSRTEKGPAVGKPNLKLTWRNFTLSNRICGMQPACSTTRTSIFLLKTNSVQTEKLRLVARSELRTGTWPSRCS